MTRKKNSVRLTLILVFTLLFSHSIFSQTIQYSFPNESDTHEGTWLQWPHQYEYGISFRNENDATWVAMTSALQANEKVHIIAYNAVEQARITNLLTSSGISLTNIDFKIMQTNDVWVRDNGPIYVKDANGNLVIEDFGFNGWGGDYAFSKDNPVPSSIGALTGMPVVNLNGTLTIEGGAIEMDGNGVFLATKTSILSQANPTNPSGIHSVRNLGKTQAQVEAILTQNLGATKFIWLDGWFSTDDITDAHIDGFAKFALNNILVTMNQTDLLYWGVPLSDINILYGATNANNVIYTKVYLPLTVNNVSKTNGTNLGYKGSYANYYVANNRVLVPNYNDPNDAIANSIISGLYPGRTVVGIDVRNLYGNGGMIHCVTQQQPLSINITDIQAPSIPSNLIASATTSTTTNISWTASTDNIGVTGYEVYQGVSLVATVSSNNYTVTGLTPSTSYSFSIKAKDAAGNISAASNTLSITTLALTTTINYCTSKGNDASGEVIKKVVFASINKTSTATVGYENFTSTSSSITKGNTYSIAITPQWFYGTYSEGYAVFIDFNNDGDFTDAGEKVWTKSPTTSASVSGSITIPTSATLGNTRMRVSMKYNGIPSSCETFSYGQVEDYTLTITSGTSMKMMPSINDDTQEDFIIYPNPIVGSELNVQFTIAQDETNYKIFSMAGLLIKQGKLLDNKIDISLLQLGVYFIEITLKNKRIIKRFIKE